MRISDWSSDVCSSDLYRDQDVPDPRARQQAGEGDAVVEIDLIGIDRERETRRRRQREAEAVVLRLLRLEWLRTERLRDRRVGLHDLGEHRDIEAADKIDRRRGLREVLLRQRGGAEAVAERTSQCEPVGQLIACAHLAAADAARAVVEMLEAARRCDTKTRAVFNTEIAISAKRHGGT